MHKLLLEFMFQCPYISCISNHPMIKNEMHKSERLNNELFWIFFILFHQKLKMEKIGPKK